MVESYYKNIINANENVNKMIFYIHGKSWEERINDLINQVSNLSNEEKIVISCGSFYAKINEPINANVWEFYPASLSDIILVSDNNEFKNKKYNLHIQYEDYYINEDNHAIEDIINISITRKYI